MSARATKADPSESKYYVPQLTTLPDGDLVASLGEKAYYLLRDKIVCLELKPGDTIREQELMSELEVGRSPVREAVQRLARDHLVTIAPQRGSFVSDLSLTDLARMTEIRVENCGLAARCAAVRATSQERAEMRRLLARLDKLGPHPDQRVVMRLGGRIHTAIARASHNDFLVELMDRYYNLSLRVWFVFMEQIARVRSERPEHPAVEQYREILEAIIAGDAAHAEAAMQHHIEDFDRDVRKAL